MKPVSKRRRAPRKDDADLRRARRLVARAVLEFGAPSRNLPRSPGVAAIGRRPLTREAKRRVVSLIAEFDLVIKALRRRQEEIGREAGFVFRSRQVASAYGRVGTILRRDRRAHRKH